MKYTRETEIFKALAHPVRIEIIRLLSERELCVCEILESLKLDQPIISQHLAVLRHSGVVDSEKRGLRIYYWLKSRKFAQLVEILEEIIAEELEAQRQYLLKTRKTK